MCKRYKYPGSLIAEFKQVKAKVVIGPSRLVLSGNKLVVYVNCVV